MSYRSSQISAEHDAWVPKEPPRALVVDDEESVRRVIAKILNHCGLKVDQASGGAEALSRVKTSIFDVVFTDITMPGMGGGGAPAGPWEAGSGPPGGSFDRRSIPCHSYQRC